MDTANKPERQKPATITLQGPFGVHDTLREGFKSFAHDLAPKHPLQSHLQSAGAKDELRRRVLGEQSLGLHMPFRLDAEKALVLQTRRQPALPSSSLGYEILMGTDESIDVSDILNVSAWSPGSLADFQLS